MGGPKRLSPCAPCVLNDFAQSAEKFFVVPHIAARPSIDFWMPMTAGAGGAFQDPGFKRAGHIVRALISAVLRTEHCRQQLMIIQPIAGALLRPLTRTRHTAFLQLISEPRPSEDPLHPKHHRINRAGRPLAQSDRIVYCASNHIPSIPHARYPSAPLPCALHPHPTPRGCTACPLPALWCGIGRKTSPPACGHLGYCA